MKVRLWRYEMTVTLHKRLTEAERQRIWERVRQATQVELEEFLTCAPYEVVTAVGERREMAADGWLPIGMWQPKMNVMYDFDETGQWWRPSEEVDDE